MKRKAVFLILLSILLVVPTIFLSGCTTGEVVAPFNPKPVKPEPYNPEATWNDRSDTTLAGIQLMKQESGQTTAPSGISGTTGTVGTAGGTSGGTTGSLIPGGTSGETQQPGSGPGPTPGPTSTPARIPLATDPIYGVVTDRIEGGVIPNATVVLTERRGQQIATFETAASGEFSFTNIPVGYYHLTVTANGYTESPLSSADVTYFGIPVVANLQLVCGMPWQIIEGGNFSTSVGVGTVLYTTSDGMITDPPPKDLSLPSQVPPQVTAEIDYWALWPDGSPDAMRTPFYSSSTQQVYDAIKFDDAHGQWDLLPGNIYTSPAASPGEFPLLQYQTQGEIGSINGSMYTLSNYATGTAVKDAYPYRLQSDGRYYLYGTKAEAWAEYDFPAPAPVANSYSYDGLWVTFPNNYKVDDNGIWVPGGSVRYWYYDWHDSRWILLGNTQDNTLGYVLFTGVNPTTGEVSIRAAAYDQNPFVITQVRLAYDYRKDTVAPTFYEQHAEPSWDPLLHVGAVDWIVKLQEEGFVTINVTGPTSFQSRYTFYSGTIGRISGHTDMPAGNYSYTITAADLPGNTRTYGPYSFTISP